MKKKIVIKLQLSSHKCKAKVMEIASVSHGVTSIAITGDDKDQLEVIGEGMDPAKLTSSIRKKVSRNAKLVLVEEVKPKDGQEPKNPPLYYYYTPPVYSYETVYNPGPPACSIM